MKNTSVNYAFQVQKFNHCTLRSVDEIKPASHKSEVAIDIEYNKRLDRQRPCLKDELNGGSNNIVQSNKSV